MSENMKSLYNLILLLIMIGTLYHSIMYNSIFSALIYLVAAGLSGAFIPYFRSDYRR